MVPSLSLIVLLTDPPLIATLILKPVNRVTLQSTDTNTVSLLARPVSYRDGGWYDDTRPVLCRDGGWYDDTRPVLCKDGER